MKLIIKSLSAALAALMLISAFGCININTPVDANNTQIPATEAPADTAAPASEEPTAEPPAETELPPEETEFPPEETELPPEETEAPTEAPTAEPTSAPVENYQVMIPEIFAAYERTYVLYPNGELFGWGINDKGQIGDGTTKNVTKPTKILDDVKKVFICKDNTYVIRADGTLWGWGSNESYILGIRGEDIYKRPVKIMDNVVEVSFHYDSAGWYYGNYFLTKDHTLLKTGEVEDSYDAIQIIMRDVAQFIFPYALKTNGDLYTTTYYTGPVLLDSNVKELVGVCDSDGMRLAYLKKDAELWYYRTEGEEHPYIVHSRLGKNVEKAYMVGEGSPVLGVKKDGTAWKFSCEYNYQTREFEVSSKKVFDKKVTDVALAYTWFGFGLRSYAFILLENGDVYSFSNYCDRAAAGIKEEGDRWYDEVDFVKVAKDAKSVYTNGAGSYIIKKDGSLWGCGDVKMNFRSGGIGDGTYDSVWGFKRIVKKNVVYFAQLTRMWVDADDIDDDTEGMLDDPEARMASTRYIIKADGSIWAWGSGKYCSIGNGSTKRQDKPVKIMEPRIKY